VTFCLLPGRRDAVSTTPYLYSRYCCHLLEQSRETRLGPPGSTRFLSRLLGFCRHHIPFCPLTGTVTALFLHRACDIAAYEHSDTYAPPHHRACLPACCLRFRHACMPERNASIYWGYGTRSCLYRSPATATACQLFHRNACSGFCTATDACSGCFTGPFHGLYYRLLPPCLYAAPTRFSFHSLHHYSPPAATNISPFLAALFTFCVLCQNAGGFTAGSVLDTGSYRVFHLPYTNAGYTALNRVHRRRFLPLPQFYRLTTYGPVTVFGPPMNT